MELLIVSGMSGAGKSVAMNALEDIGFFCIDNVPAGLLPSIMAFSRAGEMHLKRVAVSMDVRGCRSEQEIEQALDQLDRQDIPYKILFLEASDEVLMRRYSATRRRHPISIAEGVSMQEAFERERLILKPGRITISIPSCSPPPRTRSASAIFFWRKAAPGRRCG